MTQATNGIEYPIEPILLVRPCLIDICVRVRPAAKMLSALLYHARACTDDVFHLHRSQSQIVADTTDEVCEKTLCDVATPILQSLGYIEADASTRIIHYTVHMDRIRQAVSAYKKGKEFLITLLRQFVKTTLETVLMSPTLETVLMSIETVLMSRPQHKNQFQCSLEPVLKTIRDSSNVKRGRKARPQEAREPQSENTEIDRDNGEIDTRESSSANADEIAHRYEKGHAAIMISSDGLSSIITLDDLDAATARLLVTAVTDIQEQKLYTSSPQVGISDTVSHSHSHIPTSGTVTTSLAAIRNEGAAHDHYLPRIDRTHGSTAVDRVHADGHRTEHAASSPQDRRSGPVREPGVSQEVEAAPLQEQPHALQATLQGGTPSLPTQETRKPRGNKKVVEEKPAIQLTEQQQAFWLLWCDIWFNQDIPPELNDTAYKHVKKLAPHISTKEQLDGLIKHARTEMEASGFKRKVVHLGNLVNSYAGWKQSQRSLQNGTSAPQNYTGTGRALAEARRRMQQQQVLN